MICPATPEIRAIWASYAVTRSVAFRNQLATYYMPVVYLQADKMHAKLPPCVEIGDLICDGSLGLIRAVETFDLTRNLKFNTFAGHRVWGAMVDGLRLMDWTPRLCRHRAAKYTAAVDYLTSILERAPEREEIRDLLGMSEDVFQRLERDAVSVTTNSLHGLATTTDSSLIFDNDNIANAIQQSRERDPAAIVADRDDGDVLRDAIAELPTRERAAVDGVYFKNRKLKAIGQDFDVVESRMSQIRQAGLRKLRSNERLRERLAVA